MTENMAARGEGPKGLVAKWRGEAQSYHSFRKDIYENCADELETALEAAAPPSTPTNEHELLVGGIVRAALELAILRGDLRMDSGDAFEEMSESEREDVISDTWNAMNGEGTCDDSPVKELTAIYAALATPSPQAPHNELSLVRLVLSAHQTAYAKFHNGEGRGVIEADQMAIGYASVELAKVLAQKEQQ